MATPSTPHAVRDDALAVLLRLREAGHVAYFAGGCVRDMLLGLEPKDFDVATDAPPDRVRSIFPSTQAVGAAFGVILVREKKSVVEVATFRTDLKYTDGRRPEGVVFTTAEEDAKRRDFTINGLFFDPVASQVIDYVDGQRDLQSKTLRAIGEPNHRFDEDYLRLLRAIRFAARFGLTIEPSTSEAIARHAESLKRISPERIADELRLMLMPPTRRIAFALLREFGLIRVLCRQLPGATESVENRTAGVFSAIAPADPSASISFGLALAALVLDFRLESAGNFDPLALLGDDEVRRGARAMRQTLKISNDEYDRLIGSLSFGKLLNAQSPTVAAMKRFLASDAATDAMLLMSAMAGRGLLTASIQPLVVRLNELKQTEFAPPPLVSGDDLVAAGLPPGPLFKRILDATYDAQLEDQVATKSEAMQMALNFAKKL